MSRRLVIPPGTTTDARGILWTVIAAVNKCDAIEELGDAWCVANGINGLGICMEIVVPLPPSPEQLNYATIIARIGAALTANNTYLRLAAPTQAQAVAQVKVLTRECNGLIRILANLLTDISDTSGG